MKLTYFDGMCKGMVAPFLCEMTWPLMMGRVALEFLMRTAIS